MSDQHGRGAYDRRTVTFGNAAAIIEPPMNTHPSELVYLAGPMTGKPDHGLPEFAQAAHKLRAAGYSVLNPGASGADESMQWVDYESVSDHRSYHDPGGTRP